jgi:hypothetical protein
LPTLRTFAGIALGAMTLSGCVVITAVRQPCGIPGEPEIELGLGASAYTPLPEDGRVPWEIGPQGGMHVTGALQASGLDCGTPDDHGDPDDPVVTWVIERDGEVVGGFEGLRRWLEPGPDGGHRILNEHLLLYVAEAEEVEGAPLWMRASVEDRCGRVAEAEAEVEIVAPTVVPPPP